MKILVTGAAGFIGFHLSQKLINLGYDVVGLDNLNHYYDVKLKLERLKHLGIDTYEIAMGKHAIKSSLSSFRFFKIDLTSGAQLMSLFEKEQFQIVINLAAQAGVRYSMEQPRAYIQSNIVGFANLLEASRNYKIQHLIYASSSSVYGLNVKVPFSTSDNVDNPASLYAATKKSNELMAHAYTHLYGLQTTGLRFFTVYGPWGRPDMAYFLFTKGILENRPIKVFNNGDMSRDFTYIDDVIEGVVKVMEVTINDSSSDLYRLYNIGNNSPTNLLEFIETIESKLGRTAQKQMLPMQPGDVHSTYADVTDLMKDTGYKPTTSLEYGIGQFVDWYKLFFGVPHTSTSNNT